MRKTADLCSKMIDTHCHLYLEDFRHDLDTVILRAQDAGVSRFYLPAIDSKTMPAMLQLEEKYPGTCHAMMGLHPCSVKENYEDELRKVEGQLFKRKFSAVGEIGLDFYWDKTFTDQQYKAFNQQIEWALELALPIVIHSRNSLRESIDIVKSHQKGNLRGIFHCFSGDHDLALEIIDTGFYLGIGGVVTYKNAGLAEALVNVPLEHMVLETDAPYLTPVPFRGKRNESSYLKYVVEKLALVKSVTPDEVAAITTANAEKIFGG